MIDAKKREKNINHKVDQISNVRNCIKFIKYKNNYLSRINIIKNTYTINFLF